MTPRSPSRVRLAAVALLALLGSAAPSALVQGALAQETVALWPDGPPNRSGLSGPETGDGCVGNVTEASLTVHHPAPENALGAAVLVVPGGGYSVVCLGHEGAEIADWLTDAGFTVGVLKYRLPNGRHRVPLQDAQQALRLMRRGAPEWGVAQDRVGILGFSAGGHLASSVGTRFAEDFSGGRGDHLDLSHRPDFMVLVYPVVTMLDDHAHGGSRTNLLGEAPTEAVRRGFSNHLNVTANTPPTFVVHSTDDQVVHPANSLALYAALIEHGVPAELHVFEAGGHGYALSPDSPARAWRELAESWLRRTVEQEE